MQGVSPDDRTWLRTFPHHVEPEHDEWFPGVLLRCDQANHWSSGTTLCSLLGALHQERFSPKSHMIVVPSPVRELFAQMVGLPQERILATTYQTELARLYGMHNPHSRLLNAKLSFHLCPACMTHGRLLKRTLTLPHLTACSLHGLELQNRCRCGRPLVLFFPGMRCPLHVLHVAGIGRTCLRSPSRQIVLNENVISIRSMSFFWSKEHLDSGI